ncbi:MAG: carboxyl transferase domain-containing protein [Acidimicrobiales bacterium]
MSVEESVPQEAVSHEDRVADLHARADVIRTEMGGADKVAKMAAEGDRTVRQHIDGFVDDGTFREIGTFSRSLRPEARATTPGDGKIGGHGNVNGRPVALFGDDITVLRGSSSIVGTRKEGRLFNRALAMGIPIVHFGETGGGRIPDVMGSEVFLSQVNCLILPLAATRFRWRRSSLASHLAARRSSRRCLIMW